MNTLENVNANPDFLVTNVKYALMDQKLYSMAALIVSILFRIDNFEIMSY